MLMRTISLMLLMAFFSTIAFSQEEPTEEQLYEMSLEELLEVSVASNVVKSSHKQPASVTTITRKQLELSGARTLAKAIMTYVPGFFVVEDQDDVIAGFRGLAPDNNSKVLFLLNGQNMNTEWFWGPPSALLNSTNLGYIEKIEIIRGPGSVTLGQGALLGVVNVVTKNGKSLQKLDKEYGGKVTLGYGENDYSQIAAEAMQQSEELNSYFYFARTDYNGQDLRNEGWAAAQNNDGYKGGMVHDIGTRLHRSYNTMLLGNMNYKGLAINLMYADNEHDLYNFYRDRNVMGQKLMSLSAGYEHKINDKLSFKLSSDFAVDNYSLASVDGPVMGGTREDRGGMKLVSNLNLIPKNRMAIGVETRFFAFGKENFSGNNFLLNVYDQAFVDTVSNLARLDSANLYNTMGYKDNYMIFSAFLEDFYSINDNIDVFGALRFDMHPFWGNNISPRVGALISVLPELDFRVSYQAGFRGAVGLHYGGGYRQDGFLKADNYDQVDEANIPIIDTLLNGETYGDLDDVNPEKMQSIELAFDYRPFDFLSISGVGFYNKIENVIDVGVIWADADNYTMPDIGTDVPGSWNGYWYFKNTEGAIQQLGGEFSLTYKQEMLSLMASHSIVKLLNADEQQRGSMYITDKDNFKAYPENVTRVNLTYDITKKFAVAANYLYYYTWYSPRDQEVEGNHILNLSGLMDVGEHFQCNFTVKNILGQKEPYPMNSNAGDTSLSDGAPALEKPTYWVKIGYKF